MQISGTGAGAGRVANTYLKIDCIPLLKSLLHLPNRHVCMAVKDVKMGNSVFGEEWAGNASVESG